MSTKQGENDKVEQVADQETDETKDEHKELSDEELEPVAGGMSAARAPLPRKKPVVLPHLAKDFKHRMDDVM